ncbi:hypothetical protein BDW66DRAFT_4142 [Aspergillus desertorum]
MIVDRSDDKNSNENNESNNPFWATVTYEDNQSDETGCKLEPKQEVILSQSIDVKNHLSRWSCQNCRGTRLIGLSCRAI